MCDGRRYARRAHGGGTLLVDAVADRLRIRLGPVGPPVDLRAFAPAQYERRVGEFLTKELRR